MKIGPDDPLPPYTYFPKGPWPHPVRSEAGHSFARPRLVAEPIVDDRWEVSACYLRAFELFNAGYYWESHEYWEALWHAHGRKGAEAVVLQGLIRLAAAGVKVREGTRRGMSHHAAGAVGHFESVHSRGIKHLLGLGLEACIALVSPIAEAFPCPEIRPAASAVCVFPFHLEPSTWYRIKHS
ncbi:DUF309 domain-containing protein [Singulisphaera sp. PoT]|uniref:DUF309 domain-containing protein n=1 Tax=Singulisphaera sp. PoT TaxID=3411797 RepID=UPI003BF5B988